MPIILSTPGPSTSGQGATWAVSATTVQTQGVTWAVSANTAQTQGATWQVFALTQPEIRGATWQVQANTTPAIGTVPAGAYLDTTSALTGLPGPVLNWSYTHSGTYEELTATVVGQFGLDMPSCVLSAVGIAGGITLDHLPQRGFSAVAQEPVVDVGADTTTFSFRNSFDQNLRGIRLPELISWKLNPTPPSTGRVCLGIKQRKGVSSLVHEVMRLADPRFRLTVDPLISAEWIEGERDFSTENLSPQAVWDATYGLLGMVLHVDPYGPGIRLTGRWPNPVGVAPASAQLDRWTLGKTERRELLQVPTTLTLKGASYVTEKSVGKLLEWLGSHPAFAEVERELYPDMTWYDQPTSAGSGVVWRGFRKEGGKLVETVEFTLASVTVQETVEGVQVLRNFGQVGTGYKYTSSTFDPACTDRILQQRMTTKAWGFDAGTKPGGFTVDGPGVAYSMTVGDPTGDEDSVTNFVYSPQGYLAAKITTTRRLASLQQEGADLPPNERGALSGREYVTTLQTETWRPTGGGSWLYDSGVSGQLLMPVYDLESGEAVRTANIVRSMPTGPVLTDQAPPMVTCPSPCQDDVLDETGVVLRTGDAGHAEPREVNLPFLPSGSLTSVARQLLANDWGRIVTDLSLAYPVSVTPGQPFAGGYVREVRIAGTPTTVDTSITVAKQDDLLGLPAGASADGLSADPTRGKAIMLAGMPGGATVRLVKGWNLTAGQPDWEKAFIGFRSGMPPRPGDELEWELRNGQREAVRANR
jgi:hypothetical protein